MSNPIVRPFPIYANGDKIAEATEGTWKINGAVSLAITADSTCVNRGVPTVEVDIKTIVPVKGERVKVQQLCATQSDVQMEIFAGGNTFKSDGALDGTTLEWSYADGKATGSAHFIGASPDIS